MGLLDRFRKDRSAGRSSTGAAVSSGSSFPPPVASAVVKPLLGFINSVTTPQSATQGCTLARGALVMVVGESHYQDALKSAARSGAGSGSECIATLVPEPKNPYDPHAVMVCLGRKTVGYLSREDARQYRSLVDAAIAEHGEARAVGRITGGWDNGGGDVGLFGLDLYFADRPQGVGAPQADEARLVGGSTVSVSNEEHYQDGLLAALSGKSVTSYAYPVLAELVPVERNPHVKKDTGQVFEVRVGSETVGFLTPAMSARFGRVQVLASESSRRLTCSASIFRGSKAGETIMEIRLSATPHLTTEEFVIDPFFQVTTDLVRAKRSSVTHTVREHHSNGSYKTMCGVVVKAGDAVVSASCNPPIGDVDPSTRRLLRHQERCLRC